MGHITKHRRVHPPRECSRCGYTFYGMVPTDTYKTGHQLCRTCWRVLDTLVTTQMPFAATGADEQEWEEVCRLALRYVEQKQPRAQGKRFDASVPKWMRSAIEAGLVTTNSEEVHTIYSEGERVVKVERREQEETKNRA